MQQNLIILEDEQLTCFTLKSSTSSIILFTTGTEKLQKSNIMQSTKQSNAMNAALPDSKWAT